MWKTYQLKELAQIVSGDTPSTKESGYFGGEIPWITPKDLTMQRGRYISKGQRSITEAGYQSCAVHKLPSHSVLVTSRASVGNLAISQGEVCTNQGFRSLVPGEKVDYLFLYYALCYYRDRIISASSGSAFKEISMEGLGRVEISIPEDKAEQLYIANLLDEIDSLIELNDRINNNLEKQTSSLFKLWFSSGKKEETGPDVSLGDLVEIQNKSFYPNKSESALMQVYSIAAYDNGKTPEFQWSTEIGSSKFFIDNKCVLLSKLNPAICRVWMPWEVAEQAVCSSEFIVYRPKQENERIYLYALLCSQDFRQFLLSHVSGASRSRQRVSPKETLQFQISYPSKEALVSFTARVKPLYERIYLGEKQRKKLINYRDRALNVIFASQGEVLR